MNRTQVSLASLLLYTGLLLASGCAGGLNTPLDLTSLEPGDDQLRIAVYHSHEAVLMRQKAKELATRAALYERLFGPNSDWVTGTRLLAQFYEEAAREQERLAAIHAGIAQGQRAPQHLEQEQR